MSAVAATLLGGLALGAAYALIGVAVATVAIAARTLHLAIGQVLVAGVLVQTLLRVEALAGLGPLPATTAAVLAGAGVSALLVPLVLRPLATGLPRLVGLAVAAGALEALLARTLGTRTVRPDPLVVLPEVGGLDPAVIAALGIGLPAAALLALAVARTRWGRRLRLVGGSIDAARVTGISPTRTQVGAFAIAGGAAVLAGLLVAPITFAGLSQAAALTVRGVAAAALLGRGSPTWAVPAGLGLGLAEAAAQAAWPAAGGELAVAALVIGTLALRGAEHRRAWGRAW